MTQDHAQTARELLPVVHLSLGAGVQSSTLALMAAAGDVTPMPSAAIFADTQDEPASVYRWLDWLELRLPFPVYRVTKGRLGDSALLVRTARDGRLWTTSALPVYVKNRDGTRGMMQRQCTRDFKIRPIEKKSRELAGVKRGEKSAVVERWIGISYDESERMKDSVVPWSRHRWPLVELRMTRQNCLEWMDARGFPKPPRSACRYCPFHSDAEWSRLRKAEPLEFFKAVQFERDLQTTKARTDNMSGIPYLHNSLKPLDEVDFRSDRERGQKYLWGNECEGACGV